MMTLTNPERESPEKEISKYITIFLFGGIMVAEIKILKLEDTIR